MATPAYPPVIHDPGPTDKGDLLTSDGRLSHGGRAFRRELVAHLAAALIAKSGVLSKADAHAVLTSANRCVEVLVADRPTFA